MGGSDFAELGTVVQLGHAPKRIDLLTSIDGVSFDDCWPARMEIEISGVAVPVHRRGTLVINKRASGRLQVDAGPPPDLPGRPS